MASREACLCRHALEGLYRVARPIPSGFTCGPRIGLSPPPWLVSPLVSLLPQSLLLSSVMFLVLSCGGLSGSSCATVVVLSRVTSRRRVTSCDAYLEATAVQLASAQADRAHDLAWVKLRSLTCRGGAKWKGARALPGRVGEDGVAATTAQEVSGVHGPAAFRRH